MCHIIEDHTMFCVWASRRSRFSVLPTEEGRASSSARSEKSAYSNTLGHFFYTEVNTGKMEGKRMAEELDNSLMGGPTEEEVS